MNQLPLTPDKKDSSYFFCFNCETMHIFRMDRLDRAPDISDMRLFECKCEMTHGIHYEVRNLTERDAFLFANKTVRQIVRSLQVDINGLVETNDQNKKTVDSVKAKSNMFNSLLFSLEKFLTDSYDHLDKDKPDVVQAKHELFDGIEFMKRYQEKGKEDEQVE